MAFSTQNRKNEMRPLPMRITQLQFDRLVGARERDGMAVQEHVRRALDLYLDKVERTPRPAPEGDTPTANGQITPTPVPPSAAADTLASLGRPVVRPR